MEFDLARRLFDLGVAMVILALLGIGLYIAWNNGWMAYQRHFVQPRLEAERQARLEQERQATERAGEDRALSVLTAAGFELEARNQEAFLPMAVDGKADPIKVRAEFIVRKGEARFVAEVKSGSLSTSTRNGAIRRQLLEYSLLFQVTGVLLVDLRSKRVHEVLFPRFVMDSGEKPPPPKPPREQPFLLWALLAGLVLGAGSCLLLLRLAWPYLTAAP